MNGNAANNLLNLTKTLETFNELMKLQGKVFPNDLAQ